MNISSVITSARSFPKLQKQLQAGLAAADRGDKQAEGVAVAEAKRLIAPLAGEIVAGLAPKVAKQKRLRDLEDRLSILQSESLQSETGRLNRGAGAEMARLESNQAEGERRLAVLQEQLAATEARLEAIHGGKPVDALPSAAQVATDGPSWAERLQATVDQALAAVDQALAAIAGMQAEMQSPMQPAYDDVGRVAVVRRPSGRAVRLVYGDDDKVVMMQPFTEGLQ